jgi:hypothetical protein
LVQFTRVVERKNFEHLLSLGREPQKDAAAVRAILPAEYQARLLASIAEFHDGIVAQTEAPGYIANRGRYAVRRPRNLEQELVLLRLKAAPVSRRLTEVEKQTELVAKFG